MPSSSAILTVRLIFDSYFAWTCFDLPSIFAYFKKWIKESVSNFQGGTGGGAGRLPASHAQFEQSNPPETPGFVEELKLTLAT